MANFEGLTFRVLGEADIDGALALSSEAGWNQTADDWRLLIEGGRTLGVEAADGRLIASALAYVYEDWIAWIAMVLVTQDQQRHGIATELMRRVVQGCENAGLITGLDATPAGREVYRPLGFRDVYRFTRWEAAGLPERQTTTAAKMIEAGDLDRVVAFDHAVSGMDRRPLIESLWRRRPETAFLVERGGAVRGIALARDGRRALQLGPLLADDDEIAGELVQAVLGRVGGAVLVDVLDDKVAVRGQFEEAGFTEQRGYIRMLLRRDRPLDAPDRVYAVSGPEFG